MTGRYLLDGSPWMQTESKSRPGVISDFPKTLDLYQDKFIARYERSAVPP